MEDFVDILKQLRGENGCPWDIEQTHESLKPCLIEEAYEVVDAIDKKDKESLREELGDLLLQVIFHANLAEEKGWFDLKDIIESVSEKMIYRHPHVFSDSNAKNLSQALTTWEKMKKNEKKIFSYTQTMKDIPEVLPALMRSYKVQKKAADAGFDWDSIEGAFEKIKEEMGELMEISNCQNHKKKREEVGDLLFSIVNASRFLNIEPEDALRSTIRKFISRFSYIETSVKRSGKELKEMNLDEMETLWEESKNFF